MVNDYVIRKDIDENSPGLMSVTVLAFVLSTKENCVKLPPRWLVAHLIFRSGASLVRSIVD